MSDKVSDSALNVDDTVNTFSLCLMQWHLLEHAFDAILEAGEIPNPLYFTEMLLQVTSRHDYGRAVILVNAMALAPFQVSEVQWRELFEKNTDRISQNHLEKLLDSLENCDVKSEPTVVNLSRALHSLCEFDTSWGLTTSAAKSSSDGSDKITQEWIDEESDPDEDPLLYSSNVQSEISSIVEANTGGDFRVVSGAFDSGYDKDNETNQTTMVTGFAKDKASDDFGDPLHDKLLTNNVIENCKGVDVMGLEALLSGIDGDDDDDDDDLSTLPSAYEVLKDWKERRKK